MKTTRKYEVKALNLNDVLVSQKIEACSPDEAAKIVTSKNRYLRIQSIQELLPAAPAYSVLPAKSE